MSKSKRMFARWAVVAALVVVSGSRVHAQGVTISIGNATGPAGGTTTVDVSLNADQEIAGTQNNIAFDPMAAIATKSGKPDCTVNPAIDKQATSFAFQTDGSAKAIVLTFANTCPICGPSTNPDCTTQPACPVVMYTCKINIAEGATGDFPLTCSHQGASTPSGAPVTADCTNGMVTVGEVPTPTDTPMTGPTPTPTPVVTGAATSTVTATSGGGGGSPTATATTGGTAVATTTSTSGGTAVATATATGSRAATATATGSQAATATVTGSRPATATATGSPAATATVTGSRAATPTRTPIFPTIRPRTSDDDACAIVSPATSASGWMLLLPAAALLWIRRRSR